MKIKINLAACMALTQEQIGKVAETMNCYNISMVRKQDRLGDYRVVVLEWVDRNEGVFEQYSLYISDKTVGVDAGEIGTHVPFSTIEKLAEYNVIKFEP